jgi:hypothetical protein
VFSFSRKCFEIFANIFAFFRFLENFRENFTIFSRKSEFFVFAKIFAKISRYFRENFRENRSFSFSRKLYEIFATIFAKTKYFCETKFREISRKSAHFRMIFAFSRKLKNAFSFQPYSYGTKEINFRIHPILALSIAELHQFMQLSSGWGDLKIEGSS